MTFDQLGLAEPILRALAAEGYDCPTPIQRAAIPHVLAGRDLLGVAQTGTGKTAAFALPILDRLRAGPAPRARRPRVLVLSPTRELALQIRERFTAYGAHTGITSAVIFGGVGQQPQVTALARGVHVLVATPGRLLDLLGQGHVLLDEVQVLVLDEADRMLDLGFLADVEKLIARIPQKRQALLFSATMPEPIRKLAAKILAPDVERVEVAPPSTVAGGVVERVLFVDGAAKQAALIEIVRDPRVTRALVFTRTKHGANRVAKKLLESGVTSAVLHGNKSQSARVQALEAFRAGRAPVLVATDIAARGIDVAEVSHVINFDVPVDAESYVHRIGRTGRAGSRGLALSLCGREEIASLRDIEKLVGHRIQVAGDRIGLPDEVLRPPAEVQRRAPAPGPSRQRRRARR